MRVANGVLLTLLMLALPCVCRSDSPPQQQHPSSSHLPAFRRFFSEVAYVRPPTETVYLNSQPSRLRNLTLQETIGLSDREADLLKAVAVQCEKELRSIDRSARAVTLSARLESIDGPSDNKEFAALLLKRDEIIATAVETLKAELGLLRFNVLTSFVLEGSTNAKYFPLRAQ